MSDIYFVEKLSFNKNTKIDSKLKTKILFRLKDENISNNFE